MQETRVQSLGWEDLLEEETATHSSILAWELPWTEEIGWATVHEVAKESDVTWRLNSRLYCQRMALSLGRRKNLPPSLTLPLILWAHSCSSVWASSYHAVRGPGWVSLG